MGLYKTLNVLVWGFGVLLLNASSQVAGRRGSTPQERVRTMFKDISLDSEKTLRDFSFSCLIQCSLKPLISVAPCMGAKLLTRHFQDGRSGYRMRCSNFLRACKERVESWSKGGVEV